MIAAFGTTFQNPVLLAAGTAGFGREVVGIIDLERLGGLVTKAVSPEARSGNTAPRVAEFAGGMLNSVGLANPGLERVLSIEIPWLEHHLTRARVIVNVVGFQIEDYVTVVRALTDRPIVTAFELNVSCPNTERGGEEFGADPSVVHTLVSACRYATGKPLIVKLAPTLHRLPETAVSAARAGADGFTCVNTMPGYLADDSGPRLGAGQGGMSGPGLLPIGVWAVRRVREATDLPVIGVGGVRTADDVRQYLDAGASLVAVGTAALADPRCPGRLAAAIARG